ncbi:substrate-binding domain-containing protein [Streptomyces sp. DSM 40750]|uniref:substrate-binding domain-containing protein n=1 Tax=Streptomyces sp. DSM 40750 TaxID=2801030 RepID=UPI00214B8859|nr:substrate-binding domain-containing protein [Streptomyces sp. DSM 40750]UUU19723.1 substrate-binding domain-containing protein [Streptomyces sp. DSM 40750]
MTMGKQACVRSRKTRQRLTITTVAAILALTACSSTTASNSTNRAGSADASAGSSAPVDEKAVATTIKRMFLKDIPLETMDPVVQEAMKTAAVKFTPKMESKLQECLTKNVCETGTGSLTIGFPNDNINPWRQTFRAELTAQAISSGQVSRIIYSLGSDVSSYLANFKSLIAQRPDIIVMDTIWGAAVLPVVQQAKAAGITVVQAETPVPDAVAKAVDVYAPADLCGAYTDGAKQVAQMVGKPGTYGLYTGVPGNASAAAWQPCLQKGLKDAGWRKSIEGFTQWTPQGMTQAGNSLYASGRDPEAVAYDYTLEYFMAPYLKADRTPPILMSDVVNYAFLKQFKQAQEDGVKATAFVANSRVWYGRIGVTAGIMAKQGQKVDHEVSIPYPMVDISEVMPTYDPAMPANAPVPTLFNAKQAAAVLAAGS